MRLDQLFFLPIMGLSGSLVTLIGMFYGAKRIDLVRSTWLYTIKWGEILAVTFGLLFYFISPYFMKMFASDPAIIETGVTYIRYVVFAYPFIVVGMISGRVFQGLGNGMPGLILTTLRIAVIIIPLALLFTRVFDWGVQGVFLSQVISSFIASLIAYFWLSGNLKKVFPSIPPLLTAPSAISSKIPSKDSVRGSSAVRIVTMGFAKMINKNTTGTTTIR